MAVAVVHSAQTGTGATATLAITSATAGNLLVAFVAQTASTVEPKGKDNKGTTGWSTHETHGVSNGSASSEWVLLKVAEGGETELNPTVGTGGAIQGICYFELSGSGNAVEVTPVHTDNASGTTVTSPGLTTTNAGDMVLMAVGDGVATSNSEAIEEWTASNSAKPTAVSLSASRCWGASYLPGATLSAVTFTSKWTKTKANSILVVAIAPAAATSAAVVTVI